MKQIQSAGVITFRKKDNHPEYLVLHYNPGGHWDFPKGKMEQGETKKETALRELHEETGLTASIDEGFLQESAYMTTLGQEQCFKTVYFFVGCADDGDVKLSHEHQDYTWLPYEQAYKKLTYDDSRELLEKAHHYIMKHYCD